MARENYTNTNWNDSEVPTSRKLQSMDNRINNALSLSAEVIGALFENNVVVDKTSRKFDKVYYYDASAGTYTDWTGESSTTQTPSFPNVTVSSLDRIYIAYDDQFSGATFTLTTPAASDIGADWEYYVGSWTDVVSLADTSGGLTAAGTFSWAQSSMTSWSKEDLNTILSISTTDSLNRYWARMTPDNGVNFRIQSLIQSSAPNNELEVKVTNPVSMNVKVQPGYAIINNKRISIDAELSVTLVVPSANKKITIIQLSDSGVISTKDGSEAVSPTAPSVDSNNIKLADIEIDASDTTISTSAITDQRVFTSLNNTTISTDTTISVDGATYIINLTDSDSYFVIRDPSDSNQTMWFGQDGYGTLYPCNATTSAGDAVYYDHLNSRMEKADADVRSLAAQAIIVHKPTSTTAICADSGVSKAQSGLTAGADYYLSTTAGVIVTSVPSGTGDIIQRVGRAMGTTQLKIEIDTRPITLT